MFSREMSQSLSILFVLLCTLNIITSKIALTMSDDHSQPCQPGQDRTREQLDGIHQYPYRNISMYDKVVCTWIAYLSPSVKSTEESIKMTQDPSIHVIINLKFCLFPVTAKTWCGGLRLFGSLERKRCSDVITVYTTCLGQPHSLGQERLAASDHNCSLRYSAYNILLPSDMALIFFQSIEPQYVQCSSAYMQNQ